jgi:hypothetical protein
MRLHKNEDGRVLISGHDQLKWLGLDQDGKQNEWNNWLRASLHAYVKGWEKGWDSSLNSGSCPTPPCLEYVELDGERNPTPMYDKLCFEKVIYLCIGKSKLAGVHAEKALGIYSRHLVGDSRLDEERAANSAAAPQEAKAFVLGSEEAERQENQHLNKLRDWWSRELSMALVKREEDRDDEWRHAMLARDETHAADRKMEIKKIIEDQQERQVQFWKTVKLSLCGWMRQSLDGYFSTQGEGFFQTLKNVIQGSKQRRKTSHNALSYPCDQRATDRDMIFQLTLLSVALELMPELTPRVYDHVKNAYGKRAKILRIFLHQSELQEGGGGGSRRMSESEKPLMWTNAPNGGQQYVYLTTERDILSKAWTDIHFGYSQRRPHSCADMARTRLNALKVAGIPLGEWTSDTCTLLLPDLSKGSVDE